MPGLMELPLKLSAVVLISLGLCALLSTPCLAKADHEATIYRDEWGIPHIFADNLESASYAIGYAQAQDRLEELLMNYRRANGTVSEVLGPDYLAEDAEQRLFRHAEIARRKYPLINAHVRASIEAYQEGVRQFMKDHPEQVPSWAQEIHPWDVIALGRYIIWGWPLGEAEEDLGKAGLRFDPPPTYHGSNEMLIAPSRSALKVPLAVIDPHLTWYGAFRFYAERIYAGDYQVSGACILGVPLPVLGHSRWCSVAMTTGGPDTTDVYEEELNPANPHEYRYDGKWRALKVRTEKIGIKVGDSLVWKEVTFEESHHGPIVAHNNGKAYAMASPYAEEVGLSDQSYAMMTARNLTEMKKALAMRQLMMQNVMVATIQGDIYYQRTGRVPVRAPGVDWTRPVPGNTSKTEFRGLHKSSDYVQITNPASGYMHNCNVTPAGMMRNSPLTPDKYAKYPYLYNATVEMPRHQRSEMMTELLDAATNVTVDQMIAIAFSSQVWHAETWQERLRQASPVVAASNSEAAGHMLEQILSWNRVSSSDSTAAMAFYAFKKSLEGPARKATEPPAGITDSELVSALIHGADWLQSTFGERDVPYGRYFRIGREGGDRTFPASGGSLNGGQNDVGMATPHAISYDLKGGVMVGHGGQTSTQIVAMTNPPQSWTILPLGESDHKESGHWDDQAEKLFSKGRAASTYFMNKPELMKHVTSKLVLTRP
jgi:penicillin amidase